jgi:peptide/nickel transport system substrate-binding protein
MLKRAAVVITAMSCLTLGIVMSAGLTAASGASSTLTLENNTGVTFTDNFNPLDSSSFATEMSVRSLVYEPLFEFDSLKAGVSYPWLATAYAWSNGGKTLTFTIRTGVKWSNGSAFGPADVAATFNLVNTNPAANVFGLPALSSPATVTGNTVVLNYAAPEYSNIVAIAGTQLMLPADFGTLYPTPATATVTAPIGTGPYVLNNYSSTLVSYTANPNYWDGTPAAGQINVPSYASNTDAATALASGQLDWAGNDIENVNKIFVDVDKTTNHIYFAPGSTVTLEFNVTKTSTWLNNSAVRAAISAGVNRTALSVKGESGYEAPATSLSALILPSQSSYLASQYKNDISAVNQPKTVKSILTKAGFKKDKQGWYAKDGRPIKFSMEDPIAYSDYYADIQLMSSELKSEGIDATVDGVEASQWYTDSADGNFDVIEHWGNGGTDPYTQFDNWLDYTNSAAIGKSASADYGRYHNATAQSLLATLSATNPADTSAVKAATLPLEKLEATTLPVVPLLYGADWDEYSTANFTGFVTAANPYMDPSPSDPELPYILMQLKAS